MSPGLEMLTIVAVLLNSGVGLAPSNSTCDDATRAEAALDSIDRPEYFRAAGEGTSKSLRSEPLDLVKGLSPAVGKVPIIFVHGLCGNARNWSAMAAALNADRSLSARCQFLTFEYSGGSSITHAAYQLRNQLRAVRDRLDPEHKDEAWDQMILIGHSMGGLLSKMMVQDSGSMLWKLMARRPSEMLAGPNDARDLMRRELVFEPVPEVRRVIFIATPHRGSRLVWPGVKDIGNRLIPPPKALCEAHAALLASNTPDTFTTMFRDGLATSLDQLAWENPLLMAIDRLPIASGVARHSIIAIGSGPDKKFRGDGLVSYESAHHAGAGSELLVAAGHACLDKAEVIAEVARILKEHALPQQVQRRSTNARIRSEGISSHRPLWKVTSLGLAFCE